MKNVSLQLVAVLFMVMGVLSFVRNDASAGILFLAIGIISSSVMSMSHHHRKGSR